MTFFKCAIIAALVAVSTALPVEHSTVPVANHTGTDTNLTSYATTNDSVADNYTLDDLLDFDPVFGLGFPNEQREALNASGGIASDVVNINLAPRCRKLSEQMKTLPECYQTCFKSENGKAGVNIYEWDLKKYCGSGWTAVCIWVDYHIRPCWKWQCRNVMDQIGDKAMEWTKDTCPGM